MVHVRNKKKIPQTGDFYWFVNMQKHTCKKVLNAVECMAYKIKTNAESNGTIVLGNILKNLIPDFCIFYLLLCAESNRRVVVGIYGVASTRNHRGLDYM